MITSKATFVTASLAVAMASAALRQDQDIPLGKQVLAGCDVDVRPKSTPPLVPMSWEDLGGGKPAFRFLIAPPADDGIVMRDHNAAPGSKVSTKKGYVNTITWVYDPLTKKIKLTLENGVAGDKKEFEYEAQSTFDPLGELVPPQLVKVRTLNANPDLKRVRVVAANYGISWSFVLEDAGL